MTKLGVIPKSDCFPKKDALRRDFSVMNGTASRVHQVQLAAFCHLRCARRELGGVMNSFDPSSLVKPSPTLFIDAWFGDYVVKLDVDVFVLHICVSF